MSAEPRTRMRRVLFGASLGWLAAYAHFKLPLALPILFAEYGYGRMLAGSLMSVFALAGLVLSAAVGRRISRRGPGRPLAAAFAVLALGGMAGLAWPQSGAWMLLARALEGVGYAVLGVAGAVIAIDSAAPRHKAMVAALYATWMPCGQIVAVAVAAPAASAGLWQPLWLAGLAATAALAAWAWRLGGAWPASAAPGERQTAPAPARRLAIVGAAALFTLWSTQYMAYMTWLPPYLVEAHGLEVREAALGYAVPPAIVIVFNLAGGWLIRRGAGLARVLLPALAAQALVWLLVPVTGSGWGGIASLVAYGAGTGLTAACLFALPGALAGPGLDTARGFGVLMTGRNLGVLAGPLLLPPAIALGGWDAVAPVFGAVTMAALGLGLWVTRAAARLA